MDSYVYDENQVNIEFTNNLPDEGTGDPGSFSGTVTVADQAAQRIVIATALDGDSPRQLAQTVSDPVTGEYLLEWAGYTGDSGRKKRLAVSVQLPVTTTAPSSSGHSGSGPSVPVSDTW